MTAPLKLHAIGLIAAVLVAGLSGEAAVNDLTIVLPLRVHVLSSADVRLDASSSDAEVSAMLDRINHIWSAADIRFELESIVREQLDDATMLPSPDSSNTITKDRFIAALPSDQLIGSGFDLFLVHDLAAVAGPPGIFLRQIPAAIGSEVDPAGLNDPGRILAHELGHALTLRHVACTSAGNLMSPACDGSDRGRLTLRQITAARAQAETGRPIGP